MNNPFNYPWLSKRRAIDWHVRFIPCIGSHMGVLHRGYGVWLVYKNKKRGR